MNESFSRKEGCVARVLHYVHTGTRPRKYLKKQLWVKIHGVY
jgi:hypothetical protein